MKVIRNDKQEIEKIPREIQLSESSFFKTSKYNTFKQKLKMIDEQAKANNSGGAIFASFVAGEPFDRFDVGGTPIEIKNSPKYLYPLLSFEFAADRSHWYKNSIQYFFYANQRFQFWGGNMIQMDDSNGNSINEILPQLQVSRVFPFKRAELPTSLLQPYNDLKLSIKQVKIK
jgi:hypothetical protein